MTDGVAPTASRMNGAANEARSRVSAESTDHTGHIERRDVDGVLLLDKPLGITSNVALQRAKRAYRARKAGHTGTLDPLATGLLPICFGEATKFSQWLTDADKEYRAEVTLGITTETGDAEGRVTERRPVVVDRPQVESSLEPLRGEIRQTPHRYSALKRDGRALYDYARAGESVVIDARLVRIDALELEAWAPPVATLRIRCSKGTYVRSLAEALGEALGCGAHVSSLRRLASGGFAIVDAVPLDALEREDDARRLARLLPLTVLVAGLPRVDVPVADAARLRHGLAVQLDTAWEPLSNDEPAVAVFMAPGTGATDGFIGVAKVSRVGTQSSLVPVRLLHSRRDAN